MNPPLKIIFPCGCRASARVAFGIPLIDPDPAECWGPKLREQVQRLLDLTTLQLTALRAAKPMAGVDARLTEEAIRTVTTFAQSLHDILRELPKQETP